MSAEILDSATCSRLCEEFASITNTDTACGHFFLQDCDWKLEVALNRFFQKETVQSEKSNSLDCKNSGSIERSSVTPPGQIFKLISWNVDGLDDKNRSSRTKAVCEYIKRESPLVVFMQEVINETYRIFESELQETFFVIPSTDSLESYFTVILLSKKYAKSKSVAVEPFPTSVMGRCLLKVEADICDKPFVLMTSHLESMKEYSQERVKQLNYCFDVIRTTEPEKTVLFGGDLNLRDTELEGPLPKGTFDAWVHCGSKKDVKFTWDCLKNDNLDGFPKFKPRCRFDRIFVKPADPPVAKVDDFYLIGQQRIRSCMCFPSDHWGLCCQLSFASS